MGQGTLESELLCTEPTRRTSMVMSFALAIWSSRQVVVNLYTGLLRHDRFCHPFRVTVNLHLKLNELTKTTFPSLLRLLVLMVDVAVTWKAEFHTYFAGESGAHTDCNDFCAHQEVLRFRFSFWLVLPRTLDDCSLVSGLKNDRSIFVLQVPETVHPAVNMEAGAMHRLI